MTVDMVDKLNSTAAAAKADQADRELKAATAMLSTLNDQERIELMKDDNARQWFTARESVRNAGIGLGLEAERNDISRNAATEERRQFEERIGIARSAEERQAKNDSIAREKQQIEKQLLEGSVGEVEANRKLNNLKRVEEINALQYKAANVRELDYYDHLEKMFDSKNMPNQIRADVATRKAYASGNQVSYYAVQVGEDAGKKVMEYVSGRKGQEGADVLQQMIGLGVDKKDAIKRLKEMGLLR